MLVVDVHLNMNEIISSLAVVGNSWKTCDEAC